MLALWLSLAGVFVVRFRGELLNVIHRLPELRFTVLAALVLFFAWTFAAASGWRALLRASIPRGARLASLLEMVSIRVQAQAVNFILPTAGLAGESLRAMSVVDRPDAVKGSVVATVLDNLATTVAGLTLAAATVPLLAVASNKELQTGLLASGALIVLGILLERVPFVLAPLLLRVVREDGKIASLLHILADRPELRPAYRKAVAWHLLERAISVGEVHVVMVALNVPATLADSTAVASVFVLVSFAVFFVPAQLGVAEIAVTMACVSLGLPAEVGIAVALVRRSRQLGVSIIGLALLLYARVTRGLQVSSPKATGASTQGRWT